MLLLLLLARLTVGTSRGRAPAQAAAGGGAAGYAGRPDLALHGLVAAPRNVLQGIGRLAARALGAIWWSRTQRRGTVPRWTVLAALLLELGHYCDWLLGLVRGARRRSGARYERPMRDQQPRRAARRRPTPLAAMQPSEAVVALYRRATDLAARRGQPRRPGQTPHEHAREVAARYPEAGATLQRISDVFVEARFREAPATEKQVQFLATYWKVLRRALRRTAPQGQE